MSSYALLFSGQGFQQINKLINTYYRKNLIFKDTFEECSEYINYDLWKLIDNNSNEILINNKYIQLVILISSIAIYKLWKHKNNPLIIAGHSLGEYSALVCANSLKLFDAIKIIIFRNKFMHQIMYKKKGAMKVIIGLNQYSLKKISQEIKNLETVSIACINTNNQIVIAGELHSVKIISQYCKKLGAKIIINLTIFPPTHCFLMKKLTKNMLSLLKSIKFNKPIFPIVNNVDVQCYFSENKIRRILVKQLYSTVMWKNIIQYISKTHNISTFVEVGISDVLSKLNKNITNIPSISLNTQDNFLKALRITS